MTLPIILATVACLVTGAASTLTPPRKPARIVSMNLCTHELLLRLTPRDRIASVTWLSSDPRGSTVTREAPGLPQNRGLTEEIAGLEPDLVVVRAFMPRAPQPGS